MDNKKILKILNECIKNAEEVMNDDTRPTPDAYRTGKFFGMVVLRSRIQDEIEKEEQAEKRKRK